METQTKLEKIPQITPEEGFLLEKIPEVALLKIALKENGKLNSYIDELEYKVEQLEKKLNEVSNATSEEVKEFRKEVFYREMNHKLKKLNESSCKKNTEINNLRKENEKLFYSKLSNCRECISKRLNNENQVKVLDLETNTIHNAVMIDYDAGYVVMESDEYGRTRNTFDKVKFFI